MGELKKKEKMVYDAIVAYIDKNGYAPTLRELCIKVGINSTSTIHHIVKNLKLKGYIEATEGQRRTIAIKDKPKIIRCKDCRHSSMVNNCLAVRRYCDRLCRYVSDDFYCAHMEVKGNG